MAMMKIVLCVLMFFQGAASLRLQQFDEEPVQGDLVKHKLLQSLESDSDSGKTGCVLKLFPVPFWDCEHSRRRRRKHHRGKRGTSTHQDDVDNQFTNDQNEVKLGTPLDQGFGHQAPQKRKEDAKYWITTHACYDHQGDGNGPELINPIITASPDECLKKCENDSECTHITLFRWDDVPEAQCWLSRGEYASDPEHTRAIEPGLQISEGYAYCITANPKLKPTNNMQPTGGDDCQWTTKFFERLAGLADNEGDPPHMGMAEHGFDDAEMGLRECKEICADNNECNSFSFCEWSGAGTGGAGGCYFKTKWLDPATEKAGSHQECRSWTGFDCDSVA